MREDNLEPNEIYLAFENYEDGQFAYFENYDEAEDWAFVRQAENNKKIPREKQNIMIDNYENTIFVDIISIADDGTHNIIETVLDIGLF
ncbi:MAG: hypothetical protein R3Y32_06940 [Bacillota bacterium]